MGNPTDTDSIDNLIRRRVDEILSQKLEEKLAELKANRTPSLAIISTKGTLDWAYPPFILSSTAAALGWKVSVFFTFYGLQLLRRDISDIKVSPLGNPAMPMKMPFGPEWFRDIGWNVPNAVQAVVPGFESLASVLMKQTMRDKGVAGVEELRQACVEGGVKLIGCQMTVDLFGYKPEDFIPEVTEYCGAATFLQIARDADVSLFI